MSLAELVITAVGLEGRTKAEVSRAHGVWVLIIRNTLSELVGWWAGECLSSPEFTR
jgi:hypothetical protein